MQATVLRTIRNTVALLFLGASAAQSQPATGEPSASQLTKAADLFAQKDWRRALAAYEAIASAYPRYALGRFRIGAALLELGRRTEAEASIRQSEALGMPAPQVAYRLGQVFAEEGRRDSAEAALVRSASGGIGMTAATVNADPHLATLRMLPAWKGVVDAFEKNVHPCMHDPRYRELDFWVGDWDVHPTGKPITGPLGRNTITLEYDGCIVMEHWKSATPNDFKGSSFNLFDTTYGVWRQTWVDNSGAQHDYRGGLRGPDMVLVGDSPDPSGHGRIPTRLTLFNMGPDSVRQFSEVSADSGKTWKPNYDLMYVRRKRP